MTELEIQSTIVCIFQVFYIFLQPTLNNFYLFQLFYNNLSLRYLIVVSKIERDIKKKKQRKESLAMLQKEVKQRKKKRKRKNINLARPCSPWPVQSHPTQPLLPSACPFPSSPPIPLWLISKKLWPSFALHIYVAKHILIKYTKLYRVLL